MVERAFGMMKERWRATLFKALEVCPAFAPDVVARCAFLHNLCLKTNDIMEMEDITEPEDHPVPLHDAPRRLETLVHQRKDGCPPSTAPAGA